MFYELEIDFMRRVFLYGFEYIETVKLKPFLFTSPAAFPVSFSFFCFVLLFLFRQGLIV